MKVVEKNTLLKRTAIAAAAVAGVASLSSSASAAIVTSGGSLDFYWKYGASTGGYTGVAGETITVDLYASVLNGNSNNTDDGFQVTSGSAITTSGSPAFPISSYTNVSPFNDGVSSTIATIQDLNGDGTNDAGGTNPSAFSNGYGSPSSGTGPILGTGASTARVDFKIASVVISLPTAGASVKSTALSFVLRPKVDGTAAQKRYISFKKDGLTLTTNYDTTSTTNGPFDVGLKSFTLAVPANVVSNTNPTFTGETSAGLYIASTIDLVNGPTSFSKTVSATDTETAGASLLFTNGSLPSWVSVTTNSNGSVTYSGTVPLSLYSTLIPAFGGTTTIDIPLTVTDGGSLTDTSILRLTIVPEPTTLGLLGLGAVGMLRRRRRA